MSPRTGMTAHSHSGSGSPRMPWVTSAAYRPGMNRIFGRGWLVLGLAATLALAACGSDDSSSSDAGSAATTPTSTSAPVAAATTEPAEAGPTPTPVNRTPELDAIGVIGHSGATGYNSDGQDHDVPANSWATGTNPKVNSIYRRLLADHPALKDHNWNEAVSGSSVIDLMRQAQALLTHDPVPDIVFISSIDNDMQCDGTDEDNYDAFKSKMDEVLTYLEQSAPGIRFFFTETPFSAKEYDAALATIPGGMLHLNATGPCDVATDDGRIDPAGEAYVQQVIDNYYLRLQQLCAEREGCATDNGALEQIPASKKDFTEDLNHLTVSGLARQAAVVWDVMPAGWKR
jgi:hypothetical protein